MPDVLIRDVPPETLAALKARAKRAGRSLQQELMLGLNEMAAQPSEAAIQAADRMRKRLGRRGGPWSETAELVREDRER